MKLGLYLKALIAGLGVLDNEFAREKEDAEEKYYQQQRLAFYQVALDQYCTLRFAINTTLITLSSAALALLPSVSDHWTKDIGALPDYIKILLTVAFSGFLLTVCAGLWMYELDSKQLGQLRKKNEGHDVDIKSIPKKTGLLQKVQYWIFAVAFICTTFVAINGVWR